MNVHVSPNHTAGTTMLDAALRYAADGWPVFPCSPSNKRPLTANGFKDASTDPEQLREWWTANPNAMIGMPTGQSSDVLVLDLDIDLEKGLDGIAAAAELGALPNTVTIRTPRGGLHYYFCWKGGLGNSRGALPAGIDVRGEGGYVICAAIQACRWGLVYLGEPARRKNGADPCVAAPPDPCKAQEDGTPNTC